MLKVTMIDQKQSGEFTVTFGYESFRDVIRMARWAYYGEPAKKVELGWFSDSKATPKSASEFAATLNAASCAAAMIERGEELKAALTTCGFKDLPETGVC